MLTDQLWIIYGLIFGTVLLGVQGLYILLFKARREKSAINRRIALSAELNNPHEVMDVLRRERGIEFLSQNPMFRSLNDLLIQSGVRMSAMSFILVIAAVGILYFMLLRFSLGWDVFALALAIPLAVASIYLYLRIVRGRRIAAFSEQFPDALDVIVRGLRAGHPFRVALGIVSREMPDPIGSEFGIVADEIMFGLDQSTAVDNLCRRAGQGDLAFFATAVNVQHQTGGNLAEILTRLSRLLRSRSKLRLKIRSLSAEGRLSGICLSLTPFVLFGLLSLVSPEYFWSVRDHPLIPPALVVAFVMLAIGNVVMYRMVNFKY